MNLSLNVNGSRNQNDNFTPAPKVQDNMQSPRKGGMFSNFFGNGKPERKTYNAIQQIYKKHYTGQQEFQMENKVKQINAAASIQNLFKKGILQKDLKKSDDDAQIEDNKEQYPKEILEKTSKHMDPMQAFCDFKKLEYQYDFRKNSLQKQMFSHIKLEMMPDLDEKIIKCVKKFENEHATTWKEEQSLIKLNEPESLVSNDQKDEKDKIKTSPPTMKNRQDMTSFNIITLDDGEYVIQTIYDCVKQEHGIAFHKLEESKNGEYVLKKLQYFPTKKFQNKIYTWVSDQYVSFKVIKDSVYFYTIGIEGKKDDSEDEEVVDEEENNDYYGNEYDSSSDYDNQNDENQAEEGNGDEENADEEIPEQENAYGEEQAEEPNDEQKNKENDYGEEAEQANEEQVYNIQDNEQNDNEEYGEQQEEDDQMEGGDQSEWTILLNKFNLKTLKHKILKDETHNTEMGKEKQLEPLAVFFVDDFNSKTSSKSKEKDSLQKQYICILDVEFKLQPSFHYNYFMSGQLTIKNFDNYEESKVKQFSENSEYLINLWYPMKALKVGKNIIQSYNKTKDIKVLDEKQDTILIMAFSDGQKNFEQKQRIQKLMPNVIAAYQVNDKGKEIEDKIKDIGVPEHKEHYKDKAVSLINTHKGFNELLQYICFLNSSGLSWFDRTSGEFVNQKITFGRNYNEFFKHMLYNSNYPQTVPYKDDKNEIQQIPAHKYFKLIFDKNEKIYQNEGNMKDNIQILSSAVLTNKFSGFITIILHVLQDSRESNVVIYKIKLKNWLVNTNQDILNNDTNSFNKFFLECIKSEKQEIFQNSLLTLSRYTNQVCRSFMGITQSKQQELHTDKTYSIDGFKATQCIVTYMIKDKTRDIDDAIRNLSNNERIIFIQDQEQIKQIQIVGQNKKLFNVKELKFSDQIEREFVKPQKTIFECDDRLEIPVIAFNIDNNVLSDITFAVISGDQVLSFINLKQGNIKMNDNTHQQIGLSQSSELAEGKRKQNGQIITYYCQNYQALIMDSANKLANIIEIQVKWIPKNEKNNSFEIETSIVGVKTLILNEESLKIEIFPLFQRKNKKPKKDDKDDRSHLQICGTQIVLEIKRDIKEDNDDYNSEDEYGQESYGGSYSSDGYGSEEEDEEKKNLKTIYIHYNIRNPGFEDSEFNFVNKFTKSRIRQIDDGLYGLFTETWFNNELIQMSNQKLFNDDVLMKILIDLHRKSLNCKLLDVHTFMNLQAFLNGVPNNGVIPTNKLFQDNVLKQFEACELYGGKSMIELTSDSKIIADTVQKLKKQNKANKYEFDYISNPFIDDFCLNSIEYALMNDKDNSRYLNYQKQGLFFGKECIRMTMDYKSIIQLFLEKNDLKSAESLVKYLVKEMKDFKNMHSQIMSLMNIIIEKKWENQDIIKVFLDQENNDEEEVEGDKEVFPKQYSLESQISSMSCSQNDLPDYMNSQLTAFPKEFDRAEVDDGYFAGKIKEKIGDKKKSDELNGWPIKYSYLNIVDYAIQNRLQLVRNAQNNFEYLQALNEKFTQYDLSVWVKEILDMSVKDIENNSILRDLIDYQFVNTKRFYRFNLVIYVLFYVIPLVLQMFQLGTTLVVILNIICLFTQIYFFLYEVIDMKAGLAQYFESIWNWIDTSQFVFYFVYFIVRLYTSDQSFIPDMDEDNVKQINDLDYSKRVLHDIMPVFNFIILAQSFFGLLFYMKIFKKFGELVQLLTLCVQKVSTFTIFLSLWVVFLAFMFKILGANFEDDNTFQYKVEGGEDEDYDDNHGDYRRIYEPLIYLIQTFRNCIGDISTPHYKYWWQRIQNFEEEHKPKFYWGYISIYLIWGLWFFEIYLMVIIMLNFLIAIVSQSYENIMSQQIVTHYIQKSELTQEYMQCMDYLDNNGYGWLIKLFNYKTENFDYILIASSREQSGAGSEEWGGLVKALKSYIKEKNGDLNKMISNLDSKLDAKIDSKIGEVNSKIEEGFKQLKQHIDEKSFSE